MGNVEAQIAAIKERNHKVELDKAWELSWARRLFITALTYAVALIWLLIISEPQAAWKAFVPAGGYILSTLSLPFVKNIWAKKVMAQSAVSQTDETQQGNDK